jgi:hypothetical protein
MTSQKLEENKTLNSSGLVQAPCLRKLENSLAGCNETIQDALAGFIFVQQRFNPVNSKSSNVY